ncbi:hypothetical protein C2E23DRAFT_950093 [Lenzites betulinus]|nr:hypothetical protein C2E23DRAFT_950093 [Lenzites betulinus]
MNVIGVEEAFRGVQLREDSVRDAASALDQRITRLRETRLLPADFNEWTAVFASHVVSQNKEYRLRVKQDLYTASHSLKHLYADGGEEDDHETSVAMKRVLSVIIGALENNRVMKSLLGEFTTLHRQLSEAGQLSLADRVFIRKSLPDLELSFKKLSADAEALKDEFREFKPSFYVIAYEREVKLCQTTLGARKVTKEEVEKEVKPLFQLLLSLAEERKDVLAQCADLTVQHGMTWFERSSEYIPISDYLGALQQYDAPLQRILAQEEAHDAALRLLEASMDFFRLILEVSSVTSPSTLPGPYKKEIEVRTLRDAYAAYERICAKSGEMLQLSNPIVETLKEYTCNNKHSYHLTSMRYAWLVLAIPFIAWVIPLFDIFTPYFFFNRYMRVDVRVETLSSHVTDASQSILAVGIAMACLILPVPLTSAVCPASDAIDNSGVLMQEFIESSRIYTDGLIWNAPSPSTFTAIQSINSVVNKTFKCGAWVYLGRDGSNVSTTSDEVLSAIATSSRDLSVSLHEVLIHVEIAVTRITFMQSSVISGLKHLDEGGIFGVYLGQPTSYRLNRIISLSKDASSNSAHHAINAVDRAIVVASAITTTIDDFRQQIDIWRASQALCNPVIPLLRAEAIVSSILDGLTSLRDALSEDLEQPSFEMMSLRSIDPYPLGFVRAVASSYFDVLYKQACFLRSIRMATEPMDAE